jgi:Xaa-Pro aminopeptidase
MSTSRREFIRNVGLGFGAAGSALTELACAAESGTGESEKLLVDNPDHPEPAPMGYDRLPLDWYKATTRRLKERVAEKNVDVILLGTDHNMVYFTGCFRGSGERSTWAVFPINEDDTVYWYSPGIDRDLIQSWWCTENEYYFCYPHAEGGFPNRGQVIKGERVDLWEWVLNGLKKRGFAEKTIGIDAELTPSRMKTVEKVLPQAKLVDISDICLGMRIIKTKEEIALTQRAYRYFDKVHAFSRDYILERGTDATDFEIGQALEAYGINLMMKDVERDGKPHSAVGIYVTSQYVRTGVATAYPHPNQFFHAKVQKGDNLYVNTDILMGGHGGEGYRNYQIAPWDAQQEKMWQVVADTVQIQLEESVPGKTCSEVAYTIHKYQVDQGMQDYIYHRPAHGAGQNSEGHQPPFISLGDHTVIEEGMTFSVEPGLYDSVRGIGVNPSDKLLVLKDKAVLMSRVPFTKEWSFLTL